MTQENKELLLRDLCARFPYGVICQFIWTYSNETTDGKEVIAKENDNIKCIDIHTKEIQADYYGEWVDLENCKPYLRPMSSMTEEEIKEIQKITWQFNFNKFDNFAYVGAADDGFCSVEQMDNILEYLNRHHLDYRGLIEKDLALEAPKGMY